jgi:hypothetical protein
MITTVVEIKVIIKTLFKKAVCSHPAYCTALYRA